MVKFPYVLGTISNKKISCSGMCRHVQEIFSEGRADPDTIQGVPGGRDKTSGECSLC